MATLLRFSVPVTTTHEVQDGGEIISWINQNDMPNDLLDVLRGKHDGPGWAWAIRSNRWFCPRGKELDRREMFLAYNNATAPNVVSGNTDYSAWDD